MVHRRSSLFSIAIGIGILITGSSSLFPQAILSLDKINIDGGIIYNGDVKKARWVMKNIGKDTLVISDLHASCHCTTLKNPKPALAPGESDVLEIEFNSSGFSGRVTKEIIFSTNDTSNESVCLRLSCEVLSELGPTNHRDIVWLGTVPIGKEIHESFALKNTSGRRITVTGGTSSGQDVRLLILKTVLMPADTINIPIVVLPSKEGYVEEKLIIETDSHKQHRVPMRVGYMGVKQK